MSNDTWDALSIIAAFLAVCSLVFVRGIYRWLSPRTPVWKYNWTRFQAWFHKTRKYRVVNLAKVEADLANKQAEIEQLIKEVDRLTCSLQYWMKNPVDIDANKQLVLTFGGSSNGNGHQNNGNGSKRKANGNGRRNNNGLIATVAGHKMQDGYVLYDINTLAHGNEIWGIPFDEYHKQEVEKLVKVQRNGIVEWVPVDKASEKEILNTGNLLRWKRFK